MNFHSTLGQSSPIKNYRIVFVPSWVAKTLQRKSIPLAKMLDLNVLIEFLSYEDLACVDALQQQSKAFFGFELDMGDGVIGEWGDHPHYSSYIAPLAPQALQILKDRMPQSAQRDTQNELRDYDVALVDGHTFVVTVHCLDTTNAGNAARVKLVHTLTDSVAAHSGFDMMAQSALFVSYVESLAVSA